MSTHAHAQGESAGSPGDNASQNVIPIPHGGKPYIAGLNWAERAVVRASTCAPQPSAKDHSDALAVIGTAAMSCEDDPEAMAELRHQHALVRARRDGTLHVVKHKPCGSSVFHDGTTYGHDCAGCGQPITGPEDLSGVSSMHPLAPRR